MPVSAFNHRRRRARSAPVDSDEVKFGSIFRRVSVSAPIIFLFEEELTYNERVINFLRQPGSMELINSRLPVSCNQVKLKRKLETICKVGVPALKKYANDVDLITVLRFVSD